MTDDERSLFERSEYVTAFGRVLPTDEATKAVEDLLAPVERLNPHSPIQLSDDVVDLLSLVSDDCARRVADLLQLNEEAAANRREEFRRRLGLSDST